MKTTHLYFVVLLIGCFNVCAFGLTVLEPGYSVETFATYAELDLKRTPKAMVFGPDGNLYITHYFTGTIWRVTPDGQAQPFNTHLSGPAGIVTGHHPEYDHALYVVNYRAYDSSANYTFGDMGVYALDVDGGTTPFSTGITNPGTIAICRNNRYDHAMFISTSGPDCLWRVAADGDIRRWGQWPGSASGTVTSLVFDELGHYEYALYAGGAFGSDDPEISGLFSLDTEGNATRFCPNLVQTEYLAFDPVGDFAHKLFAIGLESFEDDLKIWRVDEHGKARVFATTSESLHRGLAFDESGALYVAEYADDVMTINRITGPRTVRVALEMIADEPEMAVARIRVYAFGSRMFTLMLGDRLVYEGPMADAVASNPLGMGQGQPLVMSTRKSAEIVLSAAEAGGRLRTFLQLKLSPQATPNSLIETDVVPGASAQGIIVPEIRKGTFPLNKAVDVALFQGQVVTIRID